jgi:hypothetical protein
MTKQRDVDALVASIRHLIEALIAQDQKQIGVHETVLTAQADLRDTLKRALGIKVEDSAS